MTNILFPTFEEMLHPGAVDPAIRARAEAARAEAPLDPVNYFNINWTKPGTGKTNYFVMPKSLTNVNCEIVVLMAKDFPTGSHKVGPAYSCMAEKYVNGEIEPGKHTLVFPSTGNYGIGGSWVGPRAGLQQHGDSARRHEPRALREDRELRRDIYQDLRQREQCQGNLRRVQPADSRATRTIRILNQFEEMGNYRFHYHVTGNTIVELAARAAAPEPGHARHQRFLQRDGLGRHHRRGRPAQAGLPGLQNRRA